MASPRPTPTRRRCTSWPALLVVGFVCNLLVRPVDERHVEAEAELRSAMSPAQRLRIPMPLRNPRPAAIGIKLLLAWSLVGIPLAWGVWQVFKKSLDLFK